jgi:O-antigen/teichoic acid export membrane protein
MLNKFFNKIKKDEYFGNLITNGSISYLLTIIGIFFGYITTIYVTNLYGATVYGTLTLVITVVSIFSMIPKFGMDVALVRIIGGCCGKKKEEIFLVFKVVFVFTLILSILFSILLLILSGVISEGIFNKPELNEYLKIASIMIVTTTIVTIVSASLQGLGRVKECIFIQSVLLQLIFLILLLFNVSDDIVLLYTYSSIISAILSLYYGIRKFSSLSGGVVKKTVKAIFIKTITIAAPMLYAGSFALLMNWIDILMLGFYRSGAEVGVFSAAQKVAGVISISLVAISSVVAPKFAEFYSKNDMQNLKKVAKQSTTIAFFTSIPIFLTLIVFSNEIMNLFGDGFIIGSTVLIIISTAQFINAICGPVGYLMQMSNNQTTFKNIILLASIVNIFLNYILIPVYGINGAATSTLITMLIWNVTALLFLRKKMGFWMVYMPKILNKGVNK